MNRASVVLSFLVVISGGYQANHGYAQVNEDWVQTYNGWYAVGVVTNSAGEIYVTGPTYQDAAHNFNYDIILAKYEMQGNEVWSLEFDETDDATNGEDRSNWITLDPSGNVLLTGTSFLNSSGRTFFTMKYDPSGNLVWKARSTSGLEATRVETDEDGNVYVMGPSSTVPSARNYVTIKYNPGGVQQWVKTYNGPNSFDDNPASLAVTADGLVAVTGGSTGGITSFDFATILYDTDGNVLWTQRYDSEEYADRGEDVTFGPGGEVYAAVHAYDPDDG